MKILISHTGGNANVRGAAMGFLRMGMLNTLVVSVAVFKSKWYYRFLRWSVLRDFKKREFDDALCAHTLSFPTKGLGRLITQKLGWRSYFTNEDDMFSSYQECKYIDKKVSQFLHTNSDVDAVYCYEDICVKTFKTAKQKNVKCVFEEPTGYWRALRPIADEAVAKYPEWKSTFKGLRDSEAKLQTKDLELKLADLVVVASSFTKNTLESYPGILAPIKVVPYGFPPVNKNRTYLPLVNRKLRLLYVGSLSLQKGVPMILEAINGLESQVELTLIGRGNTDECSALSDALSRHNYLGAKFHHEVLDEMARTDVFLFPSLFDGFGMVVSEAMSQGTPCIASTHSCGPDIITHGKDGWIVDPYDVLAIRNILLEVLVHPEKIACLGQEAARTASRYTWEQYGEKLSNVITEFSNESN